MNTHETCPTCGETFTTLAILPWGDGHQTLPYSPWLCASCGALGLITLATGEVRYTPDSLWQVVQERNPVLWQSIVQIRAAIRSRQEKTPGE